MNNALITPELLAAIERCKDAAAREAVRIDCDPRAHTTDPAARTIRTFVTQAHLDTDLLEGLLRRVKETLR